LKSAKLELSANGYMAFNLIGNHDLGGGEGFGGDSPGYPAFITSVAGGPFLAGDTIAIQFLMANDEFAAGASTPNWQIDSVSVTNAVPEPSTLVLSVLACMGLMLRRKRSA